MTRSSNPRYRNWSARQRVLRLVRARALSGEVCHICGRPIDMALPQTYVDPKDGRTKRAPWSLECDELVPVSLGGDPFDPGNVAPAHRICNQRRGNRMAPADPAATLASACADGVTSREW